MSPKRIKKVINDFLDSIYRVATELFRAGRHKQNPFLIVVEEADIYIPQQGRDGLEILQVISRRGRKRGLGVLFATQRPALVNKNVLSQCNNVFIGKLTLKNDIDSVRIFFSSMDYARQLTGLKPGQFYVQGTISDPSFIKVRRRKTPHGGATPTIKSRPDPTQIKHHAQKFAHRRISMRANTPGFSVPLTPRGEIRRSLLYTTTTARSSMP